MGGVRDGHPGGGGRRRHDAGGHAANSVPATTTPDGLRAKLEAAAGQCRVDVGFWGGVVPGNAGELAGLLAEGVLGFKCFLIPSGRRGVPARRRVRSAGGPAGAGSAGAVLLVHAELPGPIDAAAGVWAGGSPARVCAAICAPGPTRRRWRRSSC